MMPEASRRGGGSRVLLVKPDHNIPTRYHEPPLGVLSLAAYLRQVEGAEVRVLHFPVSPIGYDGLAGEIRSFRPSWIGISAVSFESRACTASPALRRRLRPTSPSSSAARTRRSTPPSSWTTRTSTTPCSARAS
jgi:hypothetical protein